MTFCIGLSYHFLHQQACDVIDQRNNARPHIAIHVQNFFGAVSLCFCGLHACQTCLQKNTKGCHGSSCLTTSTSKPTKSIDSMSHVPSSDDLLLNCSDCPCACLYLTSIWPTLVLLSDVVWLSLLVFITLTY